ncbi:MAG: transglycosylase SLT domain-containing protein [Bacteroidales bacterium]|nr:transglycosylase SLT domain-containing protein [Bacteroidales bacterium]
MGIVLACLFTPRFAWSQSGVSNAEDMKYFIDAYAANYDSLVHNYYFGKNKKKIEDTYKLSARTTERVDFETVTDSIIYKRLLSLNTKVKLEYNPRVRGYVNMYINKMRKSIDITLSLAELYFPMFEEALDKYGVPHELEYLAIIESALNTNAVSRAGATGLWQFMVQTGKNYGLEINTFVDERRDPQKASYAAARYLRDLNKIYDNWPLAIAAYNCGPGNVNKAIARSGKRDFWGIYDCLPRETRGYIPAYIGAVYMMNFYKLHGIKPTHITIPTANDTIIVYKDVEFQSVVKYLNISMDELKTLNPQYKLQFIPQSEKGYTLRLPSNKITTFIKYQDSIYSYSRDSILNSAVKEWRSVKTITHKVRKNETVNSIASQYGVSASDVRRWNHLSKKSKLRNGQNIVIYKKNITTNDTTKTTAKDSIDNKDTTGLNAMIKNINSVKTANNKNNEKNTKKTTTNDIGKTKDTTKIATDKKQENVADNNVKTDTATTITEKQKDSKNDKKTNKNETKKTPAKPKSKTITHTVKSGENLYRIALKYNTTVDKIKKDNNLKNDNIAVGKKLVIKK